MSSQAKTMPTYQEVYDLVTAYDRKDCSVDGCGEPRRYRQFCANHYAALKRAGNHPKDEPKIKVGQPMRTVVAAMGIVGNECAEWPHSCYGGYGYFTYKRRGVRAHVLVCEAWNGPKPSPKHEAAHECGNSACFNPRHLKWKTHRENIADKRKHGTLPLGSKHVNSILNEEKVQAIREMETTHTRKEMAEMFGVAVPTIADVLTGATWSHI